MCWSKGLRLDASFRYTLLNFDIFYTEWQVRFQVITTPNVSYQSVYWWYNTTYNRAGFELGQKLGIRSTGNHRLLFDLSAGPGLAFYYNKETVIKAEAIGLSTSEDVAAAQAYIDQKNKGIKHYLLPYAQIKLYFRLGD